MANGETRQRKTGIANVPPPGRLLARWQALSLLEFLMLGPHPEQEEIQFRRHSCETRAQWWDYAGVYAWAISAQGATLYYGGSDEHQEYVDRGADIERIARRAMVALPDALRSRLPSQAKNSMGWSFAMWARGIDSEWIDLTGDDPSGRRAEFRGCIALYGSVTSAAKWVADYFNQGTARAGVIPVLQGTPLSVTLAQGLMPKFDSHVAALAARLRAYPLADDLLRATA